MGCRITVELPLLLIYTTFVIIGYLVVNLITYKVCYNILHYPEANCSRLGKYTDDETLALEAIVQPYSGTMASVIELLPMTIPVLLALFVGSWSDIYGRKPALVFIIGCITVAIATHSVMLMFNELNPWFLLLATLPSMVCGGVTSFFTVILAYLNDISTPSSRGMRMATFDICQIFAALCAGLTSSYLLYATSYSAVYGMCAGVIALSGLYTYFFIPESLENISQEKPNCASVFDCNNLKELFIVAGKKREHNKRSIILILMAAIVVVGFIGTGEGNVKTQYLRNKLGWTLTKRNVFGGWSSVVNIVSTFSATYFLHNKLKIKEEVIIIVSLISSIGSSILYLVATNDGYIYASVPVGLFSGVPSPMLKAMLARMIVPSEMGKAFSLLMVLNSFCTLIASLSYQWIYNNTLNTYIGAFNYITIGLNGAVILAVIILYVLDSRLPSEEPEISSEKPEIYSEKPEIYFQKPEEEINDIKSSQ